MEEGHHDLPLMSASNDGIDTHSVRVHVDPTAQHHLHNGGAAHDIQHDGHAHDHDGAHVHNTPVESRRRRATFKEKFGFLLVPIAVLCAACILLTGMIIMLVFGCLCIAHGDHCGNGGRAAGIAMTVIGGAPFTVVLFIITWNSVYFFCCPSSGSCRAKYKEISL